jgi:hypothetical protein
MCTRRAVVTSFITIAFLNGWKNQIFVQCADQQATHLSNLKRQYLHRHRQRQTCLREVEETGDEEEAEETGEEWSPESCCCCGEVLLNVTDYKKLNGEVSDVRTFSKFLVFETCVQAHIKCGSKDTNEQTPKSVRGF